MAEAVFQEGDRSQFESLLAQDSPDVSENTPEVFVVFCGLVGLGKLINQGERHWHTTLRRYANDPRWRIREACAISLQKVGLQDPAVLLDIVTPWAAGTRLEQRAVVAALCEPALLKQPAVVLAVLILLDAITASLAAAGDAKTDSFKSLRQTLGYGWSVAAAADFNQGQPYFERWCRHSDLNIRWVMHENLGKKRLQRTDPQWTAAMLALLTTA